jgi:hypothetical protein
MNEPTQNPLGGFEQRLLRELRQVVAESPRPVPTQPGIAAGPMRLGRGLRIGLAATAAAAIAIAIVSGLSIGGGSDGKAWAVDRNPDGSVTVRIDSLADAAGLQRKLNEAGVPALVQYLPKGKTCAGEELAPPPGAVTQTNGDPSADGEGPGPVTTKPGPGPVTQANGDPSAPVLGADEQAKRIDSAKMAPNNISIANLADGGVEFTVGANRPDGTLVIRDEGVAPQAANIATGAGVAAIRVTFVQGKAEPCEVVDSPAQ